jgi:hypothetical protein
MGSLVVDWMGLWTLVRSSGRATTAPPGACVKACVGQRRPLSTLWTKPPPPPLHVPSLLNMYAAEPMITAFNALVVRHNVWHSESVRAFRRYRREKKPSNESIESLQLDHQ